jgi:hypothetical protein
MWCAGNLGTPYQFFDNAVKGSGGKAREAFGTTLDKLRYAHFYINYFSFQ